MLQFKPHGISLPLITFGPIAGLEVGTEAQFPGGGMGIVTAVGSKTTVQYLGTPLNLSRDTKVRFTNRVLSFNYDRHGIIGRTLDPLGRPLDGRPEVVGETLPVYGGILNPTRRTLAEGLIQTGFPALDAKEPIPQGVKILWMKRPEESLDYAVARTLMRARYRRHREDPLKPLTVIFCALGLTRDSILYFQSIRPRIGRTVFVLHGAADPAISALIAPQTACQIGERLAMQGEEVLLVIHDMRIFYNALAEVRGIQGAPPGKDNSPVDFYSQAARIYERAFIKETGSLTEIVVMSVPNLDHSEIGVNLTKYSTEGHIPWTNGSLDFLAALSRLKGEAFRASRPDHKALQRAITAAYSRALEVREQESLGLKITAAIDLAYLRFATLFEQSVLRTDEYLEVDQALDRCWHALGEVPPENLDIDAAVKQQFHNYRPQGDGGRRLMSSGQRLRQVKEDIARIERFLPVMKRVLTMLRAEIRNFQERIAELELSLQHLQQRWQACEAHPLCKTIEASLEAEVLTRSENLVGVDIEEVKAVQAHCRLSQVLICQSASSAAITDLAIERLQLAQRLQIERRNVARLEDAEEEFVFLINGSEQVRLPPLHEELARLARAMDEENGMAATIARLLREREADKHREMETWPLLG